MKESEIHSPKMLERFLKAAREDIDKLFDKNRFEMHPWPACGSVEFREAF